jgi:hypothetical protein
LCCRDEGITAVELRGKFRIGSGQDARERFDSELEELASHGGLVRASEHRPNRNGRNQQQHRPNRNGRNQQQVVYRVP